MDLVILFRTILKKIWILILIPILAAIVAYVLTINLKKEYLSRSQLATGFTIKDVANQDFNIMTADVKFNNLIEIMLSPQVISQTGYQLLIHDLTHNNSFSDGLIIQENIKALIEEITKEKIISVLEHRIKTKSILNSNDQLEKDIFRILEVYKYDYQSVIDVIHVERAGRSDYVNIYAKTTIPEKSAFIVNSLCDNFLTFNNSIRDYRNMGSLDTLKQQVEDKRIALSEKQKQLTDFKTMIGILDLNTSGNSKIDLISNFEQNLSQERRTLVESESELVELTNRLNGLSGSGQSTSSDLLALRKQINDLESSYERSKDPSILNTLRDLRKKRDDLAATYDIEGLRDDKRKSKELQDRIGDLRAKINSSRQNVNSLQNRIRALNSNVSSYAGKEAEMKALEQEVSLAQVEYTSVSSRYNEATSLNTSFNTTGIMQSLVGQPAIKPESSKRLIILLAAFAVTFIICLTVIILKEYFDFSIKTPSNFYRFTQINIIGSVPLLSIAEKKEKRPFFETDLGKVKEKDKKQLANLLNKLRYELESSGCKLILFTSTVNQTGKTTILSLLTNLYSKSQKRILIIDSNFSNNEITQNVDDTIQEPNKLIEETESFENLEEVGDELLVKKNNIYDIVYVHNDSVAHTMFNNIDVLGCKEGYYLQSEQFPDHEPLNRFKNLTDRYDYVFIEGPCLNTYTDSKELAKYVDGVVLVSSVHNQIRYIDKESLNFLKGLGPKFLGAILNKVDKRDLI
jgi:succinoglycan biosynthesis transport protein ExoP